MHVASACVCDVIDAWVRECINEQINELMQRCLLKLVNKGLIGWTNDYDGRINDHIDT